MQADRKRRVRIAPNLYQRPSDGKFEIGFSDSGGRWRIKTLRRQDVRRTRRRSVISSCPSFVLGRSPSSRRSRSPKWRRSTSPAWRHPSSAGDRASRTLERYRDHLDGHILPELGHIQVQKLTADVLAAFLRDRQATGLSSWTRKGMLTPLGRVLSLAVRRGFLSENPLRRLDPEELPKGQAKDEPRVLDRDEIRRLLADATVPYKPPLATAVFAGVRAMELLGLRWSCVDFERGVIAVRYQLTRGTKESPARLVELKTRGARRDVVLLPELAALLREHRRHAFQRGLRVRAGLRIRDERRHRVQLPQPRAARPHESGRSGLPQRGRKTEPHPPRSTSHVRLSPGSPGRRRSHGLPSDGPCAAQHHLGRLLA